MRLQKTVNSPTQLRLIQRKQGRDGVNNKARARIRCASNDSSSLFSPQNLPLPSLFLVSSPPLFFVPHTSTPTSPTPPPPPLPPRQSTVVALVTIQRGFSPQPRHRGNAWLFSRPLLASARPLRFHFWPDARADRCSKLEPRCRSVNLPGVLTQICGRTGAICGVIQRAGRGGTCSQLSDCLD